MTAYGAVDVIAIDGPSGTGKSTVSRGVARELGWRYLDTGAMYRALTWAVQQSGLSPADAADPALVRAISVGTDCSAEEVVVDGVHVEAEIRSPEVTAGVSAVAAVPAVRAAMLELQRSLIADGEIVVEGRDIGTVVVPDARLKIYLTASEEARATRRAQEVGADEAETGAALRRRDEIDSSRKASPLRASPDAVVVDTTEMTQDEVVDHILSLARLVLA